MAILTVTSPAGIVGVDLVSGVETLRFDDGDYQVATDALGSVTITGTSGDNIMTLTGDVEPGLEGLGGADTIYGGSGDDIVVGAAVVDQVFAGAGKDSIIGGSGDDVIDGGLGADSITGDDGRTRFLALEAKMLSQVMWAMMLLMAVRVRIVSRVMMERT